MTALLARIREVLRVVRLSNLELAARTCRLTIARASADLDAALAAQRQQEADQVIENHRDRDDWLPTWCTKGYVAPVSESNVRPITKRKAAK